MAGLTSVAFGPNDTWAVCEDAGTTWSYGLPDNIYNTLEGRSKKRRCAPTNVAAMGHGNTYAIFATDTNWWSNHDDLVEQLNEHGIHGSDVKAVSFGDCGSYLLLNRNARAITIVLWADRIVNTIPARSVWVTPRDLGGTPTRLWISVTWPGLTRPPSWHPNPTWTENPWIPNTPPIWPLTWPLDARRWLRVCSKPSSPMESWAWATRCRPFGRKCFGLKKWETNKSLPFVSAAPLWSRERAPKREPWHWVGLTNACIRVPWSIPPISTRDARHSLVSRLEAWCYGTENSEWAPRATPRTPTRASSICWQREFCRPFRRRQSHTQRSGHRNRCG